MGLISSKIVKVIYPESGDDINKEAYEWLLQWYSRTGTVCNYMFYDWTTQESVEAIPINISTDDISSIISSQERIISLVAEDVRKEDLQAFRDLLISRNCARVFRADSVIYEAGGHENVAILSGAITYVNSKQRYRIDIKVQQRQQELPQ